MPDLHTPDALDNIISGIIAPAAQAIDCDAAFPRAAIDALGQAGLLGLVSSREVGGMGGEPSLADGIAKALH